MTAIPSAPTVPGLPGTLDHPAIGPHAMPDASPVPAPDTTPAPGPDVMADGVAPLRSWPVLLLALPAFVAIWSGWVGLGQLTGFGKIHPLPGTPLAGWTLDTAITLPIGVETYAAYALRVWLTAPVWASGSRAVRFARASAVASLVLGAAGQVAYHLMTAAHVTRAPWQIVTVVACLPVVVLGCGAALAHLIRHGYGPAPSADAVPAADAADDPAAGPTAGTEPDATAEPEPDATGDAVPDAPTRPRRSPAARPGKAAGKTTADAVARLRRKYPDMPSTDIARRLGVTDRTVRRHLADLGGASGTTGLEATG